MKNNSMKLFFWSGLFLCLILTSTVAASVPTLTTAAITSITLTGAVSGGNITSNGGAPVTARGVCWNSFTAPTTSNNKTTDATGTGTFTSTLTGLTAGSTYFVRAFATNSAGTNITHAPVVADWGINTSGAYCWYGNNAVSSDQYGILYNYYTTINNSNMCPAGWRVPTDADWTVLTSYLGGESVAGGKLKEEGITHWGSPNTGAANESGFTALAGGFRIGTGAFMQMFESGTFWSSSGFDATNSWFRGLGYNSASVNRSEKYKDLGFSVRCIQGEGQVLPAVTSTVISGITSTVCNL